MGKIISGGLKGFEQLKSQPLPSKQKTQQRPYDFANESELESMKRVAAGLGLSGIEGAKNFFGLAALPAQLLGKELQPFEKSQPVGYGLGEQIKEQFGLTPEYLAPQNLAESIGQKIAKKAVPAAATTLLGVSPLAALTTAGQESLVGGALEQAGAPEIVQDIAELGTGLRAGYKAGKLKTPGQAISEAHKLTMQSIPANTQKAAAPIIEAFNAVETALTKEVDAGIHTKIQHALETINKFITGGKVNPGDFVDLRKNLYAIGYKLPVAKAAEYITPLTQGINNFFAAYAAENPTFWKHLTKRDKLTQMRHMATYLEGIGEKLVGKVPHIGPAVKSIIGNTIGEVERFVRSLMFNNEARKYYFGLVSGVAQNNPDLILKNLTGLKETMPTKQQPKRKTGIISGGLKGGY